MHPNSINVFRDSDNVLKIAIKDYKASLYDIDSIYKDPLFLNFSFEIVVPKKPESIFDIKILKRNVHHSILASHILLEENYTLHVIGQDREVAIKNFMQVLRRQLHERTNNSTITIIDSVSQSSLPYATKAEFMDEHDLRFCLYSN